jgi:hypothetical protein
MNNFDFNNLRQSFTYDCESGVLTRTRTNKAANSMDVHGYVVVFFNGKIYKAHRLIWAIVHGELPKGHIDHINGNRSDNRIQNLRVVTQQQNSHNQQNINKRNKSGFRGVCWNRKSSKWQASISVNSKTIYIGVFSTPENAHLAYLNAKKVYHPSSP